jgi:NADH-quinone oxidoreductase subunit L
MDLNLIVQTLICTEGGHAAQSIGFAPHDVSYLVFIPLMPLIGFIINSLGWMLLRDKWPRQVVNVIAVSTVAISFLLSIVAFFELRGMAEGTYLVQEVFTWLKVGGLEAPFKLTFDRLSAVMCLVVTGVGGLIHLYSTGYMAHDKAFARFFSYLNLFTFAMLILVMGSNIVLMFVGWEGVGLCSYLLIGFWYENDDNASAGKKAFIVNRIGDFGFLVGIFAIFVCMEGNLDFYDMREYAAGLSGQTIFGISAATFICIALFIGATGKSAQIPLFVWLPDAMAGPTPVSALIHAATMVTAGVYMIGRLNFIYIESPTAMMIVAGVGVLTAVFSATIALTQNDIKKVLAYSTVSQLGYMFVAMGVGAWSAGIFHLTTHAFFKALLFLGAGSVIHGMSDEQDMRKMGGLKKYMSKTFWCMAMAWVAIAGIIPFAGFVSKDEILWSAFASTVLPAGFAKAVYAVGLLAAMMTAIYMTRLMMMTFLTPSRMDEETEHHVHESPWTMWVPLAVLAVLSVFGGFLNWPHILGGHASFETWLSPVMTHVEKAHYSHSVEIGLMALSVGVALVAILAVVVLYKNHMAKTKDIAEKAGVFYKASLNKYWIDEIYDSLVITPTKTISYFILYKIIDVNIIDRIANGLGGLAKGSANYSSRLHDGKVQTYALYVAIGVLAILTFYLGTR